MKPYVVTEPAFRAFLTPGELQWIKLYWDLGIDFGMAGPRSQTKWTDCNRNSTARAAAPE